MDNRSRSALRGTTQLAIPPEEIDIDPGKEQIEISHEEDVANAKLASLKGNPGWELIKANFEATIAEYRSGRYMKEFVKTHTREEVGDKVILSNAIADELEMIVNTVEAAALALEEENSGRSQQGKL